MILRSIIIAGVAAVIGGQATALTCADEKNTHALFVNCGVDGGGLPLSASLASLQSATFAAGGNDGAVSGESPAVSMPAGIAGAAGAAGGSASAPIETAAGDISTPAAVVGENLPMDGEGRPAEEIVSADAVQAVPLPAGGLLLLGGLAGLGLVRRRTQSAG